jgi:DUF4097 and DUF4098 domain-containing protein YvlB
VTGTPDVTVITFDGAVEVRSWDQPEVRVEIEKRAPDKELADKIEVRAEQAGNAITVEVKKPAAAESLFGLKVSPSAKIVAMVPRRCNLVARSGDGSITVERIEGSVELHSGDGSLVGRELNGSVRAHTGDGSIRFEDIDGTVDLDTGDGTGTLTGRLAGVRLRTGDGSVSVRAEDGSAMTSEWEIRTGDGTLRLEVPDGFAANLDASTGDGRVQVEGFGEPTGGGHDEESRAALRRPLGAGGQLLRLRTGSGGISVRKL